MLFIGIAALLLVIGMQRARAAKGRPLELRGRAGVAAPPAAKAFVFIAQLLRIAGAEIQCIEGNVKRDVRLFPIVKLARLV